MQNARVPTEWEQPKEHLEQRIRQHTVPCLDGQITLIIDEQDVSWVSLSSACAVLGLNVRGQLQRIQRTPHLAIGLRQYVLSTRGGPQRTNCIQIDLLSVWIESLKNPQLEQHTYFLQTVVDTAALLQTQGGTSQCDSPDDPSSSPNEVIPPIYQLVLPFDEETGGEVQGSQAIVAATLPGLGQVLVVPNHPEDRAIREATLARSSAWKEEPTRKHPYYIASNEVRVSLGDPAHPLIVEDAQAALRDLQESTVLAARYILGRWHIAREQDRLAKEGSVLIQAEELLEWRGIQRHSRALYPGSQARLIDGYEQKYLDQIHRDIKLLELFYLQGQHRVMAGGQIHLLTIDGPYLRATRIQEPGSSRGVYLIAPGGWINAWIVATEAQGGLWVAELDRRIFQLHPHNDQIALRLALYLTEHWQMHLAAGLDAVPLNMEELLTASMIPIDRANLTSRFAPRVEAAIQKLVEQGIVGRAHPLQPLSTQGYRGKTWLATAWEITPPAELVKRYRDAHKNVEQPTLLPQQALPSSSRQLRKKEVRSIDAKD